MQIFVNANYDFLKWRLRATALFLVFIAVGVAYAFTKGVNMGIDFSGGASIVLRFKDTVPLSTLRGKLPDATIQQYGKADENQILIRLPQQDREGDYAGRITNDLHGLMNPEAANKHDLNFRGSDNLTSLLMQTDPDARGTNPSAEQHYRALARRIIDKRSELGIFSAMQQATSVEGVSTAVARVLEERTFLGQFNMLNQETVGPQVGGQLQTRALWAIIFSTLAMGIYVAIRFDLKFGAAAIIGLAHDVAFTFAFLALVGAEFSLITVAAFLMVIGYSINDKVVIYDRVRENVKKLRIRDEFEAVLNRSLNQTLSRTILTGGCVLLILLSLIFFGGEVIHDFALLLFVGTVIGTLSTLTVVPAVVIAWNRVRDSKKSPAAAARAEIPRNESQPRKRKAS